MKKSVIGVLFLIIISIVFTLFSFWVYSSTFNPKVERITVNELEKITEIISKESEPNFDNFKNHEEDLTVNKSVYQSVYNQVYDYSISYISKSLYSLLNSLITKKYFKNEPEKVVYLTIDDGPDPYSTPEFLEIFRQYGVKATFFMIGCRMEKYPNLVLDIYSEGHAIGNHSYTHNYNSLYRNPENFAEEIIKTENTIYSITGKKVKIFRAPGGSPNLLKSGLLKKLDELGYVFFDWNVTAADTSPRGVTKDQVINNIKRGSRNLNKVIVLMHDNHRRKATLEALPEIIEWFKEEGYTFSTLDENVKPIILIKTIHSSKKH